MRRLLFALLPLVLAACEDGGLTDATTGTYVEEKDISQTGDADYLTKGCDAQGNPVIQIDSRVKTGLKIGVINKVQTEGVGVGEVGMTTTVTNVTATGLAQKYTIDKATNFTGFTVGSSFNVACTVVGDNVNCTSNDAPKNTGAEHAKYEDCGFTAQPQVTGKLTKGKYTFSGSTTPVTAYKLTLQGKGPVKCGNETFNEATLDYSMVTSNDIPSTDFNFCGGTLISFYTKLAGGGKTLKATFTERANAGTTALAPQASSKPGPELPAFYFANKIDGEYLKLRPTLLQLFTKQ